MRAKYYVNGDKILGFFFGYSVWRVGVRILCFLVINDYELGLLDLLVRKFREHIRAILTSLSQITADLLIV